MSMVLHFYLVFISKVHIHPISVHSPLVSFGEEEELLAREAENGEGSFARVCGISGRHKENGWTSVILAVM